MHLLPVVYIRSLFSVLVFYPLVIGTIDAPTTSTTFTTFVNPVIECMFFSLCLI